MKNEFSQNEKEFFIRQKRGTSKLKIGAIAISSLCILGLMIDAFNGFYVLRTAKSLFWGISGLILLSIFYLFGEASSEWINSKDDVSHPLYKRVFHLFILLILAGAIMATCWYVFNRL